MGPIQTAIGQALGVAGGAAVAAKALNEKNEKQALQESKAAANEEAADNKKREEAYKKAIKTAQDKKIDSPKQVYFWGDSDEAVGTSNEIAYVLSSQSLSNAQNSKKRARDNVRKRKQELAKRKLAAKK